MNEWGGEWAKTCTKLGKKKNRSPSLSLSLSQEASVLSSRSLYETISAFCTYGNEFAALSLLPPPPSYARLRRVLWFLSAHCRALPV